MPSSGDNKKIPLTVGFSLLWLGLLAYLIVLMVDCCKIVHRQEM